MTMARAIVKEHGLDPTGDAPALLLAIRASGWRVRLQRSQKPGRTGRPAAWWQGEATYPESGAGMVVSGPTQRHVLVRVLGQILEWRDDGWGMMRPSS